MNLPVRLFLARLALVGSLLSAGSLLVAPTPAHAAGGGTAEVKAYLMGKLQRMDKAAHDYVANSNAYQALLDQSGGDYDRAALEHGPEMLALVRKMQDNFKVFHNEGYETVEGITAGTKEMVDFDTYLDAGVPKSEATTDSPSAPLVLRARGGRMISDREGNLFHYVIEPTLWGTKEQFVFRLKGDAAAKMKPITVLPRADVCTASADECAKKLDELLAIGERWQPTLDECVGALVWMTPTLNAYFDDWRDSRYNPNASLGRYVAESRVLDMRGIMSSLQIICNAILPQVQSKDPALAARLKSEYGDIISFIDRVDARERAGGSKVTAAQIEELAYQAKRLTDQLTPHLKQMAKELDLRLPPKPTLV